MSVVMANQAVSQDNMPHWNGNLQTRLGSDFDKSTEFTIRRAKLWIYGNVPKADFISYKFQMVYRSFKDDALMFQDAYADIRLKSYGRIRAGRFVPDFMLQRMQPDYEIPVLERAAVINSLIHNEKQMARETGVQYMFQRDSLPMHFSLGVFNANVDKPTHSKDNSLLYTSRLVYKIVNHEKTWLNIGGSVAYRHLDKSSLTTIYKPDSLITGNDFRWGFEAQLHWNNLELQGEYVQANINSDKADGWYCLADYTFMKKYQAVAITEKYTSLNPSNNNNAWYGVGFNYLISGKTKLMTDLKTQKSGTKLNYLGEIQLQVFFN
ncbi:MAG: porin [Bacteroidales bacterium]